MVFFADAADIFAAAFTAADDIFVMLPLFRFIAAEPP